MVDNEGYNGCRSPTLPRMWDMTTTGLCLVWAGTQPVRPTWAPSPMSTLLATVFTCHAVVLSAGLTVPFCP